MFAQSLSEYGAIQWLQDSFAIVSTTVIQTARDLSPTTWVVLAGVGLMILIAWKR